MSLQRMPNGQYVEIAPGTPPEVVARIRAQYPARLRTAAPAGRPETPVSASEARIRREVAERQRTSGRRSGIPLIDNTVGRITRPLATATDNAVHGMSFGLDDVLEGGVAAASAALQGRDAGQAYRETREVRRRIRDQNDEETPVSGGIGTVVGLVGAPVRSVLGLGARGVTAVAPRAAPMLARAARATAGPIGTGAVQGATQAGLMTLADTDGDVGRAAQSAIGGGIAGGAGGAVVGHLAPGIARAFRDRRPGQAERVAYDKIASMLSRGRDDVGQPLTPGSARAEITDATNRGTPTTLGDLTPEMSGLRGELVRRTELPSAGDVAAQAEQRLATAADRFDDQIRGRVRLTSGSGDDALKTSARIEDARKAQGAADYAKGGAMDRPLAPTPEIRSAIRTPTPDMREALKLAQRAFANDPAMGPFFVKVRVGDEMVDVPTTRAFDEIKKAFDDLIEDGIKYAPDGRVIVSNASRAASKQIRALKDQVAKSNPEYAELVGRQRDAFERLESLNAGRTFLDRIRKQPREVLADLTARDAKNVDEVRTGLIDALLAMRNSNNSPIKLLRSWERNPQQRAVLEIGRAHV